MIHHKKLRWERQKQDLDHKLQVKEQEFQTQKMSLEQKNVEVAYLRVALHGSVCSVLLLIVCLCLFLLR